MRFVAAGHEIRHDDIGRYERFHGASWVNAIPERHYQKQRSSWRHQYRPGVDTAVAGDEANGTYQTGARAAYGVSNRVALTTPVRVRSVNGPAMTTIIGSGQILPTAVRCVYLADGALLSGFTLTNGATLSSGDAYTNGSGGGVWCESSGSVVSNCILINNGGYYAAGGAYRGTLINCTLSDNRARYGAGGYDCTLTNCTLEGNFTTIYYGSGGGADYGTLNNCTLSNNYAKYGGGALYATLNNCTLIGNSADYFGGGAYFCTLNNCTLTAFLFGDGSLFLFSLSAVNRFEVFLDVLSKFWMSAKQRQRVLAALRAEGLHCVASLSDRGDRFAIGVDQRDAASFALTGLQVLEPYLAVVMAVADPRPRIGCLRPSRTFANVAS
jgi:predicted outer membrane repeat protein